MSQSTEAAPSSQPAPEKTSYKGAPVNPAPYTVTQPDGSTLRVRNFGDHLQRWTATTKGNYTVVKGSDGAWHYASGLTTSGKLKPSNVVAGHGAAPASAKDLAPAPIAKASQHKTPLGGTGDDKELVILVQFADQASLGSTEAQWATHYFGPTGSVDSFYNEASQGGNFGLAPAAETCGTANNGVTNWLTLPYNHPNTGVNGAATEQYIADAITAASTCVDFSTFDTNHDGDLNTDELHVTVIGAGDETSYSGPGNTCNGAPSIWGHEWSLDDAGITAPNVDGVTVGREGYTTFGEWHCRVSDGNSGHKATIGIMAHEFGHDINWPDLYDTDQSGEGVGEWSLMGSGSWGESTGPGAEPGDSPSYPDAYSLYYQGWVMPTPITTPTNDIAVAAHQSLLLGPNPSGTDWLFGEHSGTGEFFMLENRSQHGYDVSTPGCGIVVYRIDETVTPSNGANADEDDPLIAVIQADGDKDLEAGNNRGDDGDPYPGSSANHDLDNATTPDTKFHDGTASNLDIHVDENACADTMHVDVTHVGDPSPVPVRPANDNFVDAVTVTGNSGNTTGTNEHATMEVGEPAPLGHGAASVWYSWTPSVSGNATITMAGSDYDTILGVYTGSAVNALTLVAANDDENNPGGIYTSKVQTHVTGGTTYRLAADGYDGDSGNVKLAWSLVPDVTTTPTPTPTKMATTTTATAPHKVKYKKDFDVTANVTAGATGTVTVMDGSKVLGTGTLSNGTVKIHVTKNLKPGKHTLTVSYGGSATHLASSTTVKVKVQKKKKHHH
jgi:M6 family metalloprotease-like protein